MRQMQEWTPASYEARRQEKKQEEETRNGGCTGELTTSQCGIFLATRGANADRDASRQRKEAEG